MEKVKSSKQNGSIRISSEESDLIQLHQYLINRDDSMLGTLFNYFTFLDKEQIDEILQMHSKNPEKKMGHEKLIFELVCQMTNSTKTAESVISYRKYFDIEFDVLVL